MSDEQNFTSILNNYYESTEQEKRWQETCAALTLIKYTLQTESSSVISNLENRIENVADGIRKSLERE
ncbi:TPA: hypothetical protein O4H64_003094 [Vibrio alginolyticus]|uniref:hypothetical protein n=1 Tax=Vibrio parahaemolyticus TaxID=670 RepID=UPI00041FFBB8|nr:hypothetical protein [Vibrio parahaemolyticus]HCZ9539442.1 hypothetical protein [Vibrio alginolyticus]